ncbi:MAG: PIG-L family deacetylase [Verrucomicrobiales bacterium]|nr:PIG-L family deacetylase [Verrucomicrobiales bacterium]
MPRTQRHRSLLRRTGVLLSLVLSPWLIALPARAADLLKTDVLGVFAHPDDETGVAATLARYALGHSNAVANVYVTRGEGGGNMVGTQSGDALGLLREGELRRCLAVLGVRSAYFLDQKDFFYTESRAATFKKWDHAACLARLVRLIRTLRPEVILTMNPTPTPGQHGHHQGAGILATEAFAAAADPRFEPAQLEQEGLHPWQARKLFYSGTLGPWSTTIATTDLLPQGVSAADVAGEALSHHVSQAFGNFARSPWLRRPQVFSLIRSTVPPVSAAQDLLVGLPAPEATVPLPLVDPPAPTPLRFVPRRAISWFREWAATQHLEWMAAEFPADLPVVRGEPNVVELEIDPALESSWRSGLQWELPPGWTIARRPTWSRPPRAGAQARLHVPVIPPADASTDTEIIARFRDGDRTAEARAKLHPVPQSRIPRVRRLALDDSWTATLKSAALLPITERQTWQGTPRDAADSSAEVLVAHDGEHLAVEVRVQDEAVVSNIEPDDIKGHWRSDSVEICLDPQAGAEDTTECFKVGIFPFDTQGHVRAARDADARQGPVERTAPGLQIASQRTPTGYVVRALIPLDLVSGSGSGAPRRGARRLGFNVLIYDGDKPDAARGENINESRLAWAPRSGIQGRPEDWGRIDLE